MTSIYGMNNFFKRLNFKYDDLIIKFGKFVVKHTYFYIFRYKFLFDV